MSHGVAAGRVLGEYLKRELPNYGVFDEQRYFDAGTEPLVFELRGVRFGVVICEDFWFPRAPAAARAAGRPWDMSKGFDLSAPLGAIRPVADIGHPARGQISLSVNGALRQQGETVVCVLPGHESEVDEFHCDRELARQGAAWAVRSL